MVDTGSDETPDDPLADLSEAEMDTWRLELEAKRSAGDVLTEREYALLAALEEREEERRAGA